MILSTSSSRDEWISASTAPSEVHLNDVGPRRPHIFCETAGTSALLFLCDCVAFHRRFVFQTLFAHECPSPAYAVRACRTFPNCRRQRFTDGAFAFPRLHLASRTAQWARFEFVGWSRLLRLSNSAFWRLFPSSMFPPFPWDLILPLVFASHLSLAFSFQQRFPFLQQGANLSFTAWTNLLRSSSSISVHFSPRSFSSPSRSSSLVEFRRFF